MANQQEQEVMAAFIQWLPQNISKFQGQIPDEVITPIANAKDENEVVSVLNQLSQSEEGNQLVAGIFQAFQQEVSGQTGMFKKGGKLSYLLNKFQKGGSIILQQQQPRGIRGWFWEPKFQKRDDGLNGGVANYIASNGSEITEVRGPYTNFTQTKRPNGKVTVDVSTKSGNTRYSNFNRRGIPSEYTEMFTNIGNRVVLPPIVTENK